MVQTASERKNKCRVQVSVRPKMCPCTTVFWVLASYRLKMPVKQIMVFPDETGYAVCPKCHVTMEREYVWFIQMSLARQIAESTGWQRIRHHISAKSNRMSAARRLSLTFALCGSGK